MKKTLCLLVCFAMLFGMIPNIVSALPYNPEAAEISAPVIEREAENAEKPTAPAKTETKQGKGVTGVEAGKITLIRGYNCYTDTYVIEHEDHDEYIDYTRYDYGHETVDVIIYFADEDPVELTYLGDWFWYDGDYHTIEVTDDQAQNPWGVGVHTVNCTVMGFDFTVTVEIIETPVESVAVDPITIVKGFNCYDNYYYDETAEDYVRFDCYYYNNSKTDITVNFTDGTGTTAQSLNDEVNFGNNYYNFTYSDDQSGQPWFTGTHTCTAEIMNYTFTFDVIIVESPVTNVTVTPIQLVKGSHSYWSEYYDEFSDAYVGYHHYDMLYVSAGITVYFEDQSSVTVDRFDRSVNYKGTDYYIRYEDEQDGPWEPGVYYPRFSVLGYVFTAETEIINTRVADVSAGKITIVKDTDTEEAYYYDESIYDYVYYDRYKYEDNSVEITVTLDNGETKVLHSLQEGFRDEDDEYYGIFIQADDQGDNAWDTGVHTLHCSIMNYDFTVEVEIVESPVAYVTCSPYMLVKDLSGYVDSYYDGDLGDWVDYFHYDYASNYIEIIISLKNGDNIVIYNIKDDIEYGGEWYRIEYSDGQESDMWDTGTYPIYCSLLGYDFMIYSEITDTPVTDIEVGSLRMLEVTDDYNDWYYDEDIGDYVNYYRYNYAWLPLDMTVYFEDGTVLTLDSIYDDVNYGGRGYRISFDDDQLESHWSAGAHYVSCSLLGYDFTIEVDIITSYVTDITVSPISILMGTNTELCEYYDESLGRDVTYKRYNPYYADTSVIITMENGEVIELQRLADRIDYEDDSYYIELKDDGGQDHEPWGAGIHTLTYTLMNYDFTVEVEILPSPVVYVDAPKIRIIKGHNCYTNWYYDEATDDYVPFFHYSYYNTNTAITVDFDDGTSVCLDRLSDGVEYDKEIYYIEYTDYQDLYPWEIGEHEVQCSLLGYDFTLTVEITETPVSGIAASPVTLIEGCNLCEDWYYDENADDYIQYTRYDIFNAIRNLDIEVYFDDGSSQTLYGFWDSVEFGGVSYGVDWDDDQYANPWTVGSDNRLKGKLLDREFELQVNIIPTPVVNHTSERIQVIKNCGGGMDSYYDNENEEYVTFFRYYLEDMPIDVQLYLSDGSTVTVNSLYSGGQDFCGGYYYLSFTDTQFGDPWDVGLHTVECSLLGYDFSIEVEVVESPIVSVTASEITLIKDTNGYSESYYDYEHDEAVTYYYYAFDMCKIDLTALTSDGEELTADSLYESVEYNGSFYRVNFEDPQATDPWGVGSHTVNCTWIGYDFTITVNIIECPIESVTAEPVSFYDGDFNASFSTFVNGEYVTYYYYYYKFKCNFTVNFKDGGTSTFKEDKFTYAGVVYGVSFSDDQSANNVWTVGDHQVQCSLLGVDIPLTVRILPSPIESVTVGRYTIIKDTYCNTDYYFDEQGHAIQFTKYEDVYRYAPMTVTLSDGTVFEGCLNEGVPFEGRWLSVRIKENQIPPEGIWGVGVNEVQCTLCGYDFTLEVEIIETPVDHVDAPDIVIIEDTYMDYMWYYDDGLGDWVEAGYYNYASLVNLTVYFKDGTSAKIVNGMSVRYNGIDIYFERCDDQTADNVWGVGRHRTTGRIGGYSYEFDVVIIENPAVSFDVKDAFVYNAALYDHRDVVEYLQKHITFEVTTKSGEVLAGNLYDGIVIDGFVLKPDTDNIFNWLDVGIFEYECTLGLLEDTFAVTVLRNPFDNAFPENNVRIPDDAEKVLKTAVVDGEEIQYYAYEWADSVTDIRIRFTNDVIEHILASTSYTPNDEYTEEEYDRVWENLDDAGITFVQGIEACCFDRFADDYAFMTVGMTRDELQNDMDMRYIFAGITWRFLEVTDDGRYIGVCTGTEYAPGEFDAAAFWEEIKLLYTDPDTGITDYTVLSMLESGYDTLFRCVEWQTGIERSVTISGRSFEYNGESYTVELTDDQMYRDWTVGDANYAEVLIIDDTGSVIQRGGFGVNVYKNLHIQSITVEPESVYEYEVLFTTENGAYKEYAVRPTELTVTMTVDGKTTKLQLADWWIDNGGGNAEVEFRYEDELYYLVLSGWQTEETPWHAGENTVTAKICGTSTAFTVNVIDISEVIVDGVTIIKGTQTDEFGIYHYFPHITVIYTDGSSITSDDDEFHHRYHTEISDTQDQNRWDTGTHTATLYLEGAHGTQFTVEIIENAAVSVAVNDVTLFEDKNGYRYAVYNAKTGKYERGEAFFGDVEVTVTLDDGSTASGIGQIEYEGETYYVHIDMDPAQMLNPYCLGSGTFTATAEIMGRTSEFTITVVESYYDTHAYVTSNTDGMLSMLTVLDDDKYEKGTVITIDGLDPYDNTLLYLAISAGLDGSLDFYAVSIKAEKNGSRVQPSGKVNVMIDFSAFADMIPYGYSISDVSFYSSNKRGVLTKLDPVFDEDNLTITFELNDDEYYVIALTEEESGDPDKGDVNGDGEIDNKDVTALFRYLSGANVSVVLSNCDFNNDGKVNNKDVTLLFRYLSNN